MTALEALFSSLGRTLAARHRGVASPAPDWLCPRAVQAISLPLDGSPVLQVQLDERVPARALPRRLHSRHGSLAIRCTRAPLARPHAGPPAISRAAADQEGMVTAITRDRLNPQRHYALGCAHVLAPDARSRQGDRAVIDLAADGTVEGVLCEWQPALGDGCPPSAIDAALIELDPVATQRLRQDAQASGWLPAGLSDEVVAGRAVHLQRRDNSALQGSLVARWSGRVDVGSDGYPDYFLQGAIGYTTEGDMPRAGESGAPVWTDQGLLLGMHLAGIDPASAFGATGVFGRVVPVLDWFRLSVFTRSDPATLASSARPGTRPRSVAPAGEAPLRSREAGDHDRTVLAQTLWGEARGEGEAGMKAVACVVMNRWRTRYRGRRTVAEVCLDPRQFSCWNLDDPNRAALDRLPSLRSYEPGFSLALAIADLALAGRLPDTTFGARHYVASTIRRRPDWLTGRVPCVVIGHHEFYNDIA